MQPPTAFVLPEKTILNQRFSMDKFRHMKIYSIITSFISKVNDLVQGKTYADAPPASEIILQLLSILDKSVAVFNDTPPVARDVRYGNPSFRTFIDKLRDVAEAWHTEILPPEYHAATIELLPYFLNMFGEYGRLDYGTGHELNFIAWVFCFIRINMLGSIDDLINVGLILMPKYLEIAQLIQNIYTLEPAGSHGAWSVDDYNLLPFVWGSNQLVRDDNSFTVKDIFDTEKVRAFKNHDLYLDMMNNILTVKTGELMVTSPFISEIHCKEGMSWQKVNHGMMRHYTTEVLCKWPVMQHFFFGNLIPFE